MKRILVIDPTSTEFNRGSFCYLPYLLYSSIKSSGTIDVELWEDFTATQIDSIEEDDIVYVALWSYPQVDLCKVIHRFAKAEFLKFFGYYPLIEEYNLPMIRIEKKEILSGIQHYPKYLIKGDFRHILLSDCDMHLRKYDGMVYPMFTSYGCPRSCSFCPSCVNCGHTVLEPSLEVIEKMFRTMYAGGVRNIHFTDEDFFLKPKRALEVLQIAKSVGDFNFIALAHLHSIQRFLSLCHPGTLDTYGVRLVELGFETADKELAEKMNKKNSIEDYVQVHEMLKGHTNIFWLCLSFFPGETITTLNETGDFLSKYGYQPEDLYGRLVTNSTEGGLGQFFQPYPGTKGFEDLPSLGYQLEDRPVRLLPSFLPDSFLDDEIVLSPFFTDKVPEAIYWAGVYKLPIEKLSSLIVHLPQKVRQVLGVAKLQGISWQDAAIFIAILARLRAITSGRAK